MWYQYLLPGLLFYIFVLLLFGWGGTSAFKIGGFRINLPDIKSGSFGMVVQLDCLGSWCGRFSSNLGVLTCWKTEKLKFIRSLLYWHSLGRLQCYFAEIVFLVGFVKTRCKCCFVRTWQTFSLFTLSSLSVGKISTCIKFGYVDFLWNEFCGLVFYLFAF